MHRSLTTLLLSSFVLVGCDSPKSSLGELPETSGTSHEPTDTAGESADTADDPTSVTVTGEVHLGDVGAPCELDVVPEAYTLDLYDAECGSGMCLFASSTQANPSEACTTSADCHGFPNGVICGESGFCQLDPDYIIAKTMCTDTCVEDSDCVAVDGSACQSGFVCAPIARLGEACCQPVCACRDDFDEAGAEYLEAQCMDGTEACCTMQAPRPDACGG
jgi:hypothetical protein